MTDYTDLRSFIARVDALGALRRVAGADARTDIGAITEVAAGMAAPPALLFDAIPGYAPGLRVFSNATTSAQRAALALGLACLAVALGLWRSFDARTRARVPLRILCAKGWLDDAELGWFATRRQAKLDLYTYETPGEFVRQMAFESAIQAHNIDARWVLPSSLIEVTLVDLPGELCDGKPLILGVGGFKAIYAGTLAGRPVALASILAAGDSGAAVASLLREAKLLLDLLAVPPEQDRVLIEALRRAAR